MKVLNILAALFMAMLSPFRSFAPDFMDNDTRLKLKSAAFDSFETEDETFDDTYAPEDGEAYDAVTGKRKARPNASRMAGATKWTASNGYFTVNIVNAIGANQTIELFNSLRSWAMVTNSTLTAYNPFTFSNRAAANANNTVVYAANGDLIVTDNAGAILTISCPDIPYRTLVETLKFYRISVKSLKMGFTNSPQLNNPITYTEQTFLGKDNKNKFLPKAFFSDGQFQVKQVTITQPFIIDGERGLNFLVNSGETLDLTFSLNGVAKNG